MKRFTLFAAGLLAVIVLVVPKGVRADVNDFVVTNFAADYYLDNSDKQGQMHIVEKISVSFSDFNHGILRAIPKSYNGHPLHIKINKVSSESQAPTSYTTSTSNGNEVLKIGDASRTITGSQEYTIDYTVQNVITFYDDHNELYWDINGDQWQQPFAAVSATFHLPPGLTLTDTKCFAGSYGQTQQNCAITKLPDGTVQAVTHRQLNAKETLTTVQGFQKGYFVAPTGADWWRDNSGKVLAMAVPPLLVGAWALRRWWKYGKDLRGRGVIVPEYAPPDKLSAAESSVVYSYKLDQKAVSATIIDLAIKKHLVIIEEKQKKLFKDTTTYTFKRLASDTSSLAPHELMVLNGIFPSLSAGTEVKLDSLKNKFYKTFQSLQKTMPADLTTKGYFASNPSKSGNRVYILAFVLLFAAFIVHAFVSIGLVLAALISFGFAALMPKRTAKGVAAKEAIDGLKLYMNTAEKDRIQMLQSVDAKYAPASDAPKKTVDLFEKLLPYAMVLGVEATWAKQFEDIYKTPPDWYSGNWNTFNAVYFTSSLNNSMSAMSTNFSPPSSSGSSGFGGGGFSGGGGGGGGGGGW